MEAISAGSVRCCAPAPMRRFIAKK
jgi:hypothetical protein